MTKKLPKLSDLGQQAKTESVRGVDITPHGLGIGDLIKLAVEVPAILKVFDGTANGSRLLFDVIMSSDTLTHQVIALGCDIDLESASDLVASEEALLLGPIVEQTLRAGIDPFAQLMQSIARAITPEAEKGEGMEIDRDAIRRKAESFLSSKNASRSSEMDSPST